MYSALLKKSIVCTSVLALVRLVAVKFTTVLSLVIVSFQADLSFDVFITFKLRAKTLIIVALVLLSRGLVSTLRTYIFDKFP